MDQTTVLVAGAGPTGLSLAVELARRGVGCLVVDRRPEPPPWDRATVIHTRSLEAFAQMGVIDDVLARGLVMRGFNVFAYGRKVASVDLGVLDSDYPFDLTLPENETEGVLARHARDLGARIERGWELAGIEQSASGVRVQLRGGDGSGRSVESQWLVGADGVHSTVRECLGEAFKGDTCAHLWGVIDGGLSGWSHEPDMAAIQLEPPAALPVPLPGGRWRIYFKAPAGGTSLEDLKAGLDAVSPGTRLLNPDQPVYFHTHRRLSGHYRAGRVFLAGDAAHACSPIEGHGMNTGIQDAFNLGWKLALVVGGLASERLLDSYEAERRPVAAAVGDSGDAAERLRDVPDDPAAVERVARTLTAALYTATGRGGAALDGSELGFHYRDSPIVTSHHAAGNDAAAGWAGPLPGDRVGDAGPLAAPDRKGTTSLHRLLTGGGHVLLIMAAGGEPDLDRFARIEQVVHTRLGASSVVRIITTGRDRVTGQRAPAGEIRLHDPTGSVHGRLGVVDPTLLLIRPDGHLGFRCEPPEVGPLVRHLDGLLGS